VGKAREHDIELDPDQVTVERTGSGDRTMAHLEATYDVNLVVLGVRFICTSTVKLVQKRAEKDRGLAHPAHAQHIGRSRASSANCGSMRAT
jgi:hypothetical protein